MQTALLPNCRYAKLDKEYARLIWDHRIQSLMKNMPIVCEAQRRICSPRTGPSYLKFDKEYTCLIQDCCMQSSMNLADSLTPHYRYPKFDKEYTRPVQDRCALWSLVFPHTDSLTPHYRYAKLDEEYARCTLQSFIFPCADSLTPHYRYAKLDEEYARLVWDHHELWSFVFSLADSLTPHYRYPKFDKEYTRLIQDHYSLTPHYRNYKLVKLKCRDVQLDGTVINGVFMKYLRGEEHALTINELNTYFEIHLRNRKGWQKKLDKGMREADLRSNHYKIYPHPDMGKVCDAFLCLVFWIRWVELVHLDRPMADEDFLFPAIGVNGVLQPGEPLSHDMVQKWINEAVVGSGIPSEAALTRPASTEALNMAHASLTADVASLHTTVKEVRQQLSNMSNLVVKALTLPLTYLARPETVLHQTMALVPPATQSVPVPAAQSCLNAFPVLWTGTTSSSPAIQSVPVPAAHFHAPAFSLQPTLVQFRIPRVVQPSDIDISILTSLPSHVGLQRTSTCPSVPLRIPNVPVLHVDGTWMPKSDSWRDIVRHWTEGEPQLGLYIPLKDWPHHHCNGKHGQQFNMKHHQRGVIVMEFLNEFQGDEEAFLKAYGSAASLGHTRLLKAILDAHKWHPRDGERHHRLANEVHDIPSMGQSSNDQQ
ncbi:hypothetical protein BKA82DRAFT_35867 [Pisolithus tinctorius]|uniref:Uncharacterized protein n=1 Tax=Pisolithus tinctorius Marx 270 TaxID=870435 RepID=A0A0C3I997_PISTI|nr:hypothetical protein BKA82DRAFT_35867 [Pisolithus tinctorius]KIN93687.1 hypothetical protein M404DRAFT_35867 [Pisolithus tinctorius Marx 270]